MKQYDTVILGFGKGGKTLAAKLASVGKRVALIEKDPGMYGGTCINVGCIPSKSLVHSAAKAALLPRGEFSKRELLYQEAIEEKNHLTQMLRRKNYDKLNSLELVDIFTGKAEFLSNTEVLVTTVQESFSVTGEKIIINTGSEPVVPQIEGLERNPYVFTSAELMEQKHLPKRLVIIGGGYIGMEFASMYARFGSEVTVISNGEILLPREDRDIAEAIQDALQTEGVSFRLGAVTTKILEHADHVELIILEDGRESRLLADAILVAAGRKPATDGLKAERAGVKLDSRGTVIVDENLRTTAPNIWALGDVKGGLQFTYISLDDFRILWSGWNGGSYTSKKRGAVPYSVFMTPPYSRIGMNETEAKREGRAVKIAKLSAAAIPKAQVLQESRGMLKAVIDADSGKILGAMLFCEESYEMINLIKLAMDADLNYEVFRDQIFTHPTMSEALNDLFNV